MVKVTFYFPEESKDEFVQFLGQEDADNESMNKSSSTTMDHERELRNKTEPPRVEPSSHSTNSQAEQNATGSQLIVKTKSYISGAVIGLGTVVSVSLFSWTAVPLGIAFAVSLAARAATPTPPPTPPKPTPPPPKPMSNWLAKKDLSPAKDLSSQKLLDFGKLQTCDGLWSSNNNKVWEMLQLKKDEMLKNKTDNLTEDEYVTILVMAYFTVNCSNISRELQLFTKKTKESLCQNLTNNELEAMIQSSKGMFGVAS